MKKTLTILFLTLILLGTFGVKKSWGATCRGTASVSPNPVLYQEGDFTITVSVPGGLVVGTRYKIDITNPTGYHVPHHVTVDSSNVSSKSISSSFHIYAGQITFVPGTNSVTVNTDLGNDCLVDSFTFQITTGRLDPVLSANLTCFQNNASVNFSASNLKPNTSYYYSWEGIQGTNANSNSSGNLNFQMSGRIDGCFSACISETHDDCGQPGRTYLSARSQQVCFIPQPVPPNNCSNMSLTLAPASPFDPCKNLAGKSADDCRACTGIDDKGQFNIPGGVQCDPKKFTNIGASCGTWTSLGCVPNDPPNLVGWIITLASGVAGGIAFLLILFGSFQIVTSGGVPEKIASGKDIITSALLGLLFIFLATLILKVIGVQILGIPGWQ